MGYELGILLNIFPNDVASKLPNFIDDWTKNIILQFKEKGN